MSKKNRKKQRELYLGIFFNISNIFLFAVPKRRAEARVVLDHSRGRQNSPMSIFEKCCGSACDIHVLQEYCENIQ